MRQQLHPQTRNPDRLTGPGDRTGGVQAGSDGELAGRGGAGVAGSVGDGGHRDDADAGAGRDGCGDPRVRAAMAGSTGEHLVRLNELRQVLGRAKRPAVAEWVRARVAQGEKVLVAAHHRVVVDALAAEFGGCRIQGGQSAVVKETHKARFQCDPVAVTPVIVVSIGAGGVGHTLLVPGRSK